MHFVQDSLSDRYTSTCFLFCFILCCILPPLSAQKEANDSIFDSSIRSVTLVRDGWPLSLPVMHMQEDQQLLLSFDELAVRRSQFSWEIKHCDSHWQPDDKSIMEVLDGFPDYTISDVKPSFNTTTVYWSYQQIIPGEGNHWLCSGNYQLRVFRTGDPDNTVITRRFMVAEGLCGFTIKQLPSVGENALQGQEFEITIDTRNANIPDLSGASLIMLQDYRWKFSRIIPCSEQGNGILSSGFSNPVYFEGGNEFLNIDMKNLKYISREIKKTEFRYGIYQVTAQPDTYDPYKGYIFENDLDGKFLIQCDGASSGRTEADYAMVQFSLPVSFPFDGDLYISGSFTSGSFDPQYRMQYNTAKGQYEVSFLMKQGYYNYEYVLAGKNGKKSYTEVNGSYAATQNEYLLLLYYSDKQQGYDRLAGYTLYNTLHPGN